MLEQDVVAMDMDCKITSKDSRLSDCLQSLLETAREVNKLSEGRVPLDTAFAKKQDVTPKKILKVRRGVSVADFWTYC
jgi:hypothetical protein